jgi:hypothetical protein
MHQYKSVILGLLLSGVTILGYTLGQALFMRDQIADDHDTINKCYAVLNQSSNPPATDALVECQQLEQITADHESYLGTIYDIMIVGILLLAGSAGVTVYYSTVQKSNPINSM